MPPQDTKSMVPLSPEQREGGGERRCGGGQGAGGVMAGGQGPPARGKQPPNQPVMWQRAGKLRASTLCKTAPGMEQWEKLGRAAASPLGAGGSGSSLHR